MYYKTTSKRIETFVITCISCNYCNYMLFAELYEIVPFNSADITSANFPELSRNLTKLGFVN